MPDTAARPALDAARERAAGFGYTAGWTLVRAMPTGLSRRAFRAAADAATVRNGRGTRQLRRNLRRVVGPGTSELRLDALVGAALRSYSRYWMETFRLESMDHAAVAASFERHMSGGQFLADSVAAGRGAVMALPHSGNWDASGVWAVERYGALTTVAERLRPASLFDRFVAYRESIGMEVIPLTGGDRSPTQALTQRLRENRIVCLLADRDLSQHGIEVDFFGARIRMPPGPAMLAARTGAPLHAVHSFFVGDDEWGHAISAPIPLPGERLREQVTAGTQALADAFAAGIAGRPEDWHMLQRLWLDDLPAPARAGSAAGTG